VGRPRPGVVAELVGGVGDESVCCLQELILNDWVGVRKREGWDGGGGGGLGVVVMLLR
jgi:hypothetical protein